MRAVRFIAAIVIAAALAVAPAIAQERRPGYRPPDRTPLADLECLRQRQVARTTIATSNTPSRRVSDLEVTNGCGVQVRFLLCAVEIATAASNTQCQSMKCQMVRLRPAEAHVVRATTDRRVRYVKQRARERLEVAGTERRCV